MALWREVAGALERGERVSAEQGLWLLTEARLLDLAELASMVRYRLHPGRTVTFLVDSNPNYTNVCDTDCTFCAFYRKPGAVGSYTLSVAEVLDLVGKARERGATTVLLQGGHNPDLPLSYYVDLVRAVRERFPDVTPHFFSPPEIRAIARFCGVTVEHVLETLYQAGQRTLPGGGAEILVDRVRRRISPKKGSAAEWLEVMEKAHRIGFRTTATMMYGHVEEPKDVIEHLLELRDLQDRTGGFLAFIPWSFKPGSTPLARLAGTGPSQARYLRIIATARILLDNFPHIQASWFSEGKKTGQLALEFGADDFGGTLIEENVLLSADFENRTSTEEVLYLIHDAGYVPVQRTTLYETVRVYDDPAYFRGRIGEGLPQVENCSSRIYWQTREAGRQRARGRGGIP